MFCPSIFRPSQDLDVDNVMSLLNLTGVPVEDVAAIVESCAAESSSSMFNESNI